MNDRLIDDERLSTERKSLLPGAGFFTPDSFDAEKAEREARETLDGADTVVVADPDADGLGCVALLREHHGEAALIPAGPHQLDEAVARLAEYAEAGATVYVCDLCPDDRDDLDGLETLVERADSVSWFDHHQWADADAERVRDAGVRLVVGDSDEECTTDVTLRSVEADFPARFAELAAVTRDHDLWLREDPRSDDLADYAHWEDPEEYVAVVREHGADLPEAVLDYLAERRVEKEALVEKAVERAEIEEIDGVTVGVTYGRCSQNEVAEALRERGTDAAVVVKPAGSASIRGTDAFERCHEVAAQVNGGGHPKAAGCKPDIYDDMLDYATHWTTRGAVAKQVILDGFRNLPDEEEEGTETEL
ncbi:DHH family phosphoesterase [Halosegnis marinus]|uniref:DHH family phosphoesterase n=1 Tax=Halosegnis marinus TaxID=3034023 RepID=A0ABD5ZMT8_9EURY|nr:recombinase RecJ [Halosegnis sp. DT85]